MPELKYPIPTRVKVGPHPYKIMAVKNVGHFVHDSDENMFGHVEHQTNMIHVASELSTSQLQDTVLHETLHAILIYLGKDDEGLVSLLTPPLLDVLQSNPKWVEFLTQRRLVSW